MKLKYYLRGLGIGILVSTIILMISFAGKKGDISDEEVIARAKALGMVMEYDKKNDTIPKGTELSEVPVETETQLQPETQTEQTQTEKQTEAEKQTETEKQSETEKQTEAGDQPQTEASVPEPEEPVTPQVKEIVVSRGDSSDRVAEKLEQEGLVDDASAYNRYLIEHHYDSSIQNGTFQITEGASYEEISKILTSGQ